MTKGEDYDIVMEDVAYVYTKSERPALEDIDLKMKEGEIVMITGPTGAGKTTLCRCLNGLIPHFYRGKLRGNILVRGVDTKKSTISALSHICGLIFQDPTSQLINPTVEDEVAFGPENYRVPPEQISVRVREALKATRLEGYEKRSPHFLSGGEQQACALAAVMAMRPKIFVLDEPTSSLDPLGTDTVLRLIVELTRKERKTMVIVEHKMEELVPYVDRMLVMNEGRIIMDGKPEVVLREVETMEKIGLRPPQVNSLAIRLKRRGIDIDTTMLTFEEAVKMFSNILKNRRKARFRVEEAKPVTEIRKTGQPIIEARDLYYSYVEGIPALRGLNLTIYDGDFLTIVGQNGSGKTTLVKHFVGLLKPTKGDVFVYGVNTKTKATSELAQKVGYCFQNPDHQICCETVRKELEFGPRNLKLPDEEVDMRVINVARDLGLERALDKAPYSLSRGERRRVAVASVLTMNPQTLIVDEPTTGQDKKMAEEMMEFMKLLHSKGKTMILITHDMNFVAEYAERVVVLREGKILCDGPARSIFSQPELLKTTALRPPQITRLGQALRDYGTPEDVLTVDEMYDKFNEVIGG